MTNVSCRHFVSRIHINVKYTVCLGWVEHWVAVTRGSRKLGQQVEFRLMLEIMVHLTLYLRKCLAVAHVAEWWMEDVTMNRWVGRTNAAMFARSTSFSLAVSSRRQRMSVCVGWGSSEIMNEERVSGMETFLRWSEPQTKWLIGFLGGKSTETVFVELFIQRKCSIEKWCAAFGRTLFGTNAPRVCCVSSVASMATLFIFNLHLSTQYLNSIPLTLSLAFGY